MKNVKSIKNAITVKRSIIGGSIIALMLGAGALHARGMHSQITLTDKDGDGVISADEIREVRDAHRQTMLTQFDTDGDGEMSREERKAMKQAKRAEFVQAHDTDGNGKLSRAEKRAAREAGKEAMMLQLDVNGDGEVSDAEKAGMEEIRSERGKRGKRKGGRHDKAENGEESASE